MVIIGSLNELSVGRLFAAGFLPGLLMALFMIIYIMIVGKKKGFPKHKKASSREILKTTIDAIPSLLAPVVILGVMITGVVTATEAGVIGVIYISIVGKFIHKELKFKGILDAIMSTIRITASSMLIVALAGVFGWVLTSHQIALKLAANVESLITTPFILLIALNIIMLILGCFLNTTTIIILLSPIVFPIILRYGIDPIHFALVMVMNLMIGLLTPPVGLVTFLAVGITKCDYNQYLRELWPFIIALIVLLILVTYVPSISLLIPNLIFGPRVL